jgi:ABC-2 type transport system ATP-binding protein
MVAGLRALGTTIVLTTHYLDEAEALADRIAVLDRGRIVAEGPPSELGGRDRAETRITFHAPVDPPKITGAEAIGDGCWSVCTDDPTRALYELTSWAVGQGIALGGLEVRRPSLEDVYLRLTEEGAVV